MGLIKYDEKAQLQTVTELKNKRKRPLSYELLYAFAYHEIEVEDNIPKNRLLLKYFMVEEVADSV